MSLSCRPRAAEFSEYLSTLKSRIQALASEAAIEIPPTTNPEILKGRIAGRRVYVSDLGYEKCDREHVLELLKTILRQGGHAVPNIAARRINNGNHLKDLTDRYLGAGITDVFLVAGSLKAPLGAFSNTLELLRAGVADNFNSVAFAAHPQGNPFVGENPPTSIPAEYRALLGKQAWARSLRKDARLNTQLCYNTEAFVEWMEHLFSYNINMPVYMGTTPPLAHEQQVRHIGQCYRNDPPAVESTVDEMITQAANLSLSKALTAPLAGLHVYSFEKVDETLKFLEQLSAGKFIMHKRGESFELTP